MNAFTKTDVFLSVFIQQQSSVNGSYTSLFKELSLCCPFTLQRKLLHHPSQEREVRNLRKVKNKEIFVNVVNDMVLITSKELLLYICITIKRHLCYKLQFDVKFVIRRPLVSIVSVHKKFIK